MTLLASKIKELSEQEAFSRFLKFEHATGTVNVAIHKATEPKNADSQSLAFVSTEEQLHEALKNKAAVVIVLQKMMSHAEVKNCPILFSSPAIPAAMAILLPYLDSKKSRFESKIHPTAVIHSSAKLGKNVGVGPYAVIGEKSVIGDNTLIGAHTVIEDQVIIGADCILHPQVFVGSRCSLGNRCEIHPHTTIGSDGFGYVQGADRQRHKVPQLGIVVIEDNVEIGANCAIDRATLSETRIGRGTKLDNFCHIAHNVIIGQDNAFAAALKIAGSTKLGSNILIGGNVDITDHIEIADNIIIGGRSGITKDIKEAGAYVGFPIEPMREGMKTLANLSHISSLRKQLAQIKKHLGLNDE